jgi:DNA-binding XRE family transcriptional regulator
VATELALAANRDADSAQLPAHLATALAGPDTLGAGLGPHGTQPFPTTEGPSHEAVMEALARRGFNRAQAARDLGISRTTLYQHLRDDPTVGLLTRLSDAQFLHSLDQCNGDLRLLAHRMRVPLGSVKLRAGKL